MNKLLSVDSKMKIGVFIYNHMKYVKLFENYKTNITNVINNIKLSYNEEYGYTANDINNGMCIEFSEDVIDYLGGETNNLFTLHSDYFYDDDWDKDMLDKYGYPPIDLTLLKDGLIHHQWICYNDKHYDAEESNGVYQWYDLPIFTRMINKYT